MKHDLESLVTRNGIDFDSLDRCNLKTTVTGSNVVQRCRQTELDRRDDSKDMVGWRQNKQTNKPTQKRDVDD